MVCVVDNFCKKKLVDENLTRGVSEGMYMCASYIKYSETLPS